MKVCKNNNGFTISETLVVINLALLMFIILVGFYLFMMKFSSNLNTRLSSKQDLYDQIFFISQALERSERYTINVDEESAQIKLKEGGVIDFKNGQIIINEEFSLSDSIDYSIQIFNLDKEQVFIKNGQCVRRPFDSDIPFSLVSADLNWVEFIFERNNREIKFTHYPSSTSITNFKNIHL